MCAIKFLKEWAEYSDEKTMGDLDDKKVEVDCHRTSAEGIHGNLKGRSNCCDSEVDQINYLVIPNCFYT